ncbi:metallophosphoesterase [Clostridium sp.]|uniref:metallophosphoesterase n=1 Tax=Clostridium sp. TaxID=1506 RepID=UPI003F2C6705
MVKRLKKIKGLISMALILSVVTSITPVKVMALTEVGAKGNGELVFAVISDLQLNTENSSYGNKFKNALEIINREAPDSDALIIAGDLTDNGYISQYNAFNSIYEKYGNKDSKLLTVMGNHDYWNGLTPKMAQERFKEQVGTDLQTHEVVEGYHFIQVSTEGSSTHGDFSSNLVNWLKAELDKAVADGGDKPIFLTVHQHIKGTVYGSDDWGNDALYDVLKDYPQVITFSGHSHYPMNDERSIHQRDFTSIGTSAISYTELEPGKINGSVPPNASDFSQGMILRVSEDKVDIERLDFHNDEVIKENWTVELPSSKENFKYTDERSEERNKPFFRADANITASNINEDSASITFDQGEHEDFVHSYKIDAVNKSTGAVEKSVLAFSEFYFGSNMPNSLSFKIDGLKSNTEYDLNVYAIESFGKVSEDYLSTPIKTLSLDIDETVEKPRADVFNFDFLSKSLVDKTESGVNAEIKGDVKVEYDSEINQDVVKLSGKNNNYVKVPFGEEQKNKVTEQFSLETVFKMNTIKNQGILMNTESGGIGFESTSNGTVEIWAHIGGSYKRVGVKLEKDKYYHLLASYNGSSLDLYLDGEKVASAAATGSVYHPNVHFAVGGDPSSSGAGIVLDGNIALARLYSKGVNISEVAKLYSEFDNRRNLEQVDSLLEKVETLKAELLAKPEIVLPIEEKLYSELEIAINNGINLYNKIDLSLEEVVAYDQSSSNILNKLEDVKNKSLYVSSLIDSAEAEIESINGFNDEKAKLQLVINEARDIIISDDLSIEDLSGVILSLEEAITKFKDSLIINPDKVKNLRVDEITNNSATISWMKPSNVNGLVAYDLYMDGKLIDSVSIDSNSYVINELKRNTIYGVKVIARYVNEQVSKPMSINIRTKK